MATEHVVLSRTVDDKGKTLEVKTEERPCHGSIPNAFRCKNCGHLEPCSSAGDCPCPAACQCCGYGISFTPRGIKKMDPDNWEILADCDEARLKELGLTKDQVAKHNPPKQGAVNPNPQNLERTASEAVGATNK